MKQLTERQKKILELAQEKTSVSNREIIERFPGISRVTAVRDVNVLVSGGFLEKTGLGRNSRYKEKVVNPLLRRIDVEKYFSTETDRRDVLHERFNFEIYNELSSLFSEQENAELLDLTEGYKKRVAILSPAELQKEFERLTIELSWKSSRLEGNTYSLIDTEVLIKEHKEAVGHPREEAIMILNHKKALEYVADKRSDFSVLTIGKIEAVHSLIVENMNVRTGIRKHPVGIIGTRYRPLDNEHQIREALEKAVTAINAEDNPFSKALLGIALISYIQPFEDGNKRTGRILGNAILLAQNACPLSYRSINEADYKKAVILFYEQNNLRFLKKLFVEQYKFSVENYFGAA